MTAEFTKYETRGAYHWREIGARWPPRYSARLHALYSWFVEEVEARRPGLVVDVGCGDAALTDLMARATPGRVVGIEPEASGVEFAREALAAAGSPAEVVLGRGESLPFESGAAGLVTMCEVVEHIQDIGPLCREAARVLAPGGALLVSTPQWQRPELREFHVREYRGAELAETLGEHFGRVRVQASEPGRLQDLYTSNTPTRIAVNVISQAGMNPFRLRRAPVGRAGWRQLVAIAEEPVFSANSSTRGPLRSGRRSTISTASKPAVRSTASMSSSGDPLGVALHPRERILAFPEALVTKALAVDVVGFVGGLGLAVVGVEHQPAADPRAQVPQVADRVGQVVEDADVVAEVCLQPLGRSLGPLQITGDDRRVPVEHRAADDGLHDVLDPSVDRGHPGRAIAQRDRVDALEAADLEDVAVAQAEARVEPLDPRVGDLLRGVALAAPRRAAERAALRVDGEAVPRQQVVQGFEAGVVEELDERRLELPLLVVLGGGRPFPPEAHARGG